MRDVQKILQEVKDLQDLRDGVPTFVYFGGIGGINLVRVRKSLKGLPRGKEVDVVIQSGGGQADDAYRLIRAFREKFETVNVVVPFWAKSAATIFTLGASRIVLGDFGELGPIDVQVKKDDETETEEQWSSALNVQASLLEIETRSKQGMLEMFKQLRSKVKENEEILKIGRKPLAEMLLDYSAKFYQPLLQKVETIELGTMSRSLSVGRMYAQRILIQYTELDPEKVRQFITFLAYDCPDHGYVVDYSLLKTYLPNVIKAEEAPFSEKYRDALETLSIHLMLADDDSGPQQIVGFLDILYPPKDKTIIKENNAGENTNSEQAGVSGGSDSQPNPNGGAGSVPDTDQQSSKTG